MWGCRIFCGSAPRAFWIPPPFSSRRDALRVKPAGQYGGRCRSNQRQFPRLRELSCWFPSRRHLYEWSRHFWHISFFHANLRFCIKYLWFPSFYYIKEAAYISKQLLFVFLNIPLYINDFSSVYRIFFCTVNFLLYSLLLLYFKNLLYHMIFCINPKCRFLRFWLLATARWVTARWFLSSTAHVPKYWWLDICLRI